MIPPPLKACLNTFQMSTNVMGFQKSRKITNIFGILILVTKVDLRPWRVNNISCKVFSSFDSSFKQVRANAWPDAKMTSW
jgi:hypothetical protein